MKTVIVNPTLSFLKKNGSYAIYVNFGYIFLRDSAAKLFDELLCLLDNKSDLSGMNIEFLDYLKSKKIIVEVNSCTDLAEKSY